MIQLSKKVACLVLVFFASTLSVQAADFDAAAKYSQTCGVCHASGVAGAPKTGDKAAWETRLAGGMDALVASVKKGKGAMPPKGLCPDCSDEQIKALIKHMAK